MVSDKPQVAAGLTLICVHRINTMPESKLKPILAFIGHDWKLDIEKLGGYTTARRILIHSIKYN